MISKLWDSCKYGVVVFCILIIYMFSKSSHALDEDVLCSYVIDYRTGFGGRKLLASIANLAWGDMTVGRIRLLVYAINTFFCFLFAWACNAYLQAIKVKGKEQFISALYVVALYLACPAAIMFLLQYPNVGRIDLYHYTSCIVLCFMFYHRDKCRVLYYISVFGLMAFCILAHHVFVASYMPFFVALFVYDIWNKGFDKRKFAHHAVLGIACCSVLASVLFLSSMNITLDDATHINPKIELSRKFVCYGYYAKLSDHIQYYVIAKHARLIAGFLLTFVYMSPLIYALWRVWYDLFSSLKDQAARKLLIGVQCAFLLQIPAYLITVDYLRWFGAFFFMQMLLICFFSFDKSNSYSGISEVVLRNLKNNIFYATILLVYCANLDLFTSDTYFDGIELIMEKLHIYRVPTLLPIEYRL